LIGLPACRHFFQILQRTSHAFFPKGQCM
jgi:hypothetical protein